MCCDVNVSRNSGWDTDLVKISEKFIKKNEMIKSERNVLRHNSDEEGK